MSRLALSALIPAVFATLAATSGVASATCYNCYQPQVASCPTCYQQVVTPPQYRTTYHNVMVNPGRVVSHRVPARYDTVYETVVVPRTVMVEPERVMQYTVPPRYATVPRVEMVAPAQHYYAPVQPRCGGCY